MEAENDTKVILISSDSKKFELPAKAAKRSKLIKESIEDSKEDITSNEKYHQRKPKFLRLLYKQRQLTL